jgi:signal transduction histidine kinase
VTGISLVSWLWRPVGRLREIGWGDIALAGVLSIYAVCLVSGVVETGYPHGGVVAAVAVLAMTVPVAWERRAPAAAAAAVAVGAVLNELFIGPMVRCGPALPAVLVIAFFAGTRLDGRKLAVAVAFCLGSVITQAFFDPRLGAGFLVAGVPAVAGFCLAGRLARSHGLAAAALRERNAELREQREQTARLAVAADRGRVAADLEEFLGDRIATMAAAAAAGRELIAVDPAGAQGAFAAIENSGRATLSRMRGVVGTLREEALAKPQPVLAQLGSLLERVTSADARLHVEGSPRALPAGVELSGYRIVEHLLAALQDAPEARIDVRVRFGPDALELHVAGPASRQADPVAAFAVARERAALLGGTLRFETGSGRCAALVRLPLTAGYAYS